MSFIVAASALVSTGLGVYQAIEGKEAAGIAAEEAREAREELMAQRERFAELDTSNPFTGLQNMYDGMDNKMDGLRVNTQQAEFEKQQAMQGQANILGQLRQGAGASGIAALAQSLANEGSLQAQRASASIGDQEAKNQALEAAEASRIQDLQLGEDSRIQGLERKGDLMSRNMQFGMLQSQMGMTAGDVSNAQANFNTANQQMFSGIGMAAGGVGDLAVQAGTWGDGGVARANKQNERNLANDPNQNINFNNMNSGDSEQVAGAYDKYKESGSSLSFLQWASMNPMLLQNL